MFYFNEVKWFWWLTTVTIARYCTVDIDEFPHGDKSICGTPETNTLRVNSYFSCKAIRTRFVALNYISQPHDVTRESVPTGTGYRKQMRKRDDQSSSPKSMILHNCINPQRKLFKTYILLSLRCHFYSMLVQMPPTDSCFLQVSPWYI